MGEAFAVCSTGNDRYSGDRFSGNDRFSGTKTPDDAILFTVSGITVIVELFLEKFDADLSKVGILKLKKLYKTSFIVKNMMSDLQFQYKSQSIPFSWG